MAEAEIVVDHTQDAGDAASTPDAGGSAEATKAELAAAFEAAGDDDAPKESAGETPVAAPPPVVAGATPADATTTPPAAGSTPALEPPKDIAAIIRAREEAQALRTKGRSEADEYRETAKQEASRILDQAKLEAAKVIADERARFTKRFAESPLETINEYGIPREKLVDEVTADGSPQTRMIRELRQELAKRDEKLSKFDAFIEAQNTREKEWHQRQQVENVRAAERSFLTHTSAEKTPALAKLPEDVRVTLAHKKAAEWNAKGITFDHGELASYLEHEASSWLTGAAPQVERASGNAAQAKANGSRAALSATTASERRATPKPYDQIEDEAERKRALREAFDEAAEKGA